MIEALERRSLTGVRAPKQDVVVSQTSSPSWVLSADLHGWRTLSVPGGGCLDAQPGKGVKVTESARAARKND